MTESQRAYLFFVQTGSQYYVVARSAARSSLMPVAGNLFHHALESFMKSFLALSVDLADLAEVPYRHDLPSIWSEFKKKFPTEDLTRFDNLIKSLHSFEEVRYPDRVIKKGMIATLSWKKGTSPAIKGSRVPRRYDLCVQDLDDLIAVLFRLCQIDVKQAFCFVGEHGHEALADQNLHYATWFPEGRKIPVL
jgi:hypothetical protein